MPNKRYLATWVLIIIMAWPLFAAGPGSAGATASVAESFVDYDNSHQGLRVLGYPLTDLIEVEGVAAQYFEKKGPHRGPPRRG